MVTAENGSLRSTYSAFEGTNTMREPYRKRRELLEKHRTRRTALELHGDPGGVTA
jgi:hypothetical protein